jgi:hypothetical protein
MSHGPLGSSVSVHPSRHSKFFYRHIKFSRCWLSGVDPAVTEFQSDRHWHTYGIAEFHETAQQQIQTLVFKSCFTQTVASHLRRVRPWVVPWIPVQKIVVKLSKAARCHVTAVGRLPGRRGAWLSVSIKQPAVLPNVSRWQTRVNVLCSSGGAARQVIFTHRAGRSRRLHVHMQAPFAFCITRTYAVLKASLRAAGAASVSDVSLKPFTHSAARLS